LGFSAKSSALIMRKGRAVSDRPEDRFTQVLTWSDEPSSCVVLDSEVRDAAITEVIRKFPMHKASYHIVGQENV
jgi:hypothetical protein